MFALFLLPHLFLSRFSLDRFSQVSLEVVSSRAHDDIARRHPFEFDHLRAGQA